MNQKADEFVQFLESDESDFANWQFDAAAKNAFTNPIDSIQNIVSAETLESQK